MLNLLFSLLIILALSHSITNGSFWSGSSPSDQIREVNPGCPLKCGRGSRIGKRSFYRMIGGEVVDENKWPWLFELKTMDCDESVQFYCTAELISSTHLVTSAHCLFRNYYECTLHPSGQKKTTFVPYSNTEIKAIRSGQTFDIRNFSVAATFDENSGPLNLHKAVPGDIGILELEEEVSFEPICLASAFNSGVESKAYLVGFGATRVDGEGNSIYDRKMRSTQVDIAKLQRCRSEWGEQAVLCAGSDNHGGMTGDSGSALTTHHLGLFFAQGIFSRYSPDTPSRNLRPDLYEYEAVATHCEFIERVTNGKAKCINPYSIPIECVQDQRSINDYDY